MYSAPGCSILLCHDPISLMLSLLFVQTTFVSVPSQSNSPPTSKSSSPHSFTSSLTELCIPIFSAVVLPENHHAVFMALCHNACEWKRTLEGSYLHGVFLHVRPRNCAWTPFPHIWPQSLFNEPLVNKYFRSSLSL
jgi:hypothetical protein